MLDFDVAMDKLCSLETSHDIAEFFKGQQIKGHQINPHSCPIATWVKESTGYRHVSAVPEVVFAWNGNLQPLNEVCRDATTAMTLFMRKFDNGEYPELIKETNV